MKKIFIYTSLTICLAAGAGVFIYLEGREAMRGAVISFGAKPGEVGRIAIKSGEEFFLERGERHWFVAAASSDGWRIVGDVEKIDSLFEVLSNLIPLDTVTNYGGRNAGDLGFEHVDAHLKLFKAAESSESEEPSLEVVVGRRGGDGDSWVWLSSSADSFYRIPKSILDFTDKTAKYYYDKRVLPFDATKAVRLQLAQKYAGGWTVVRTDDGFKFELPAYLQEKEAAGAEVRLYLLMLAGLRADEFVTCDLVEGDEPEAFINVWLEGKTAEPLRLDLYRDPAPGAGYLAVSSYQESAFRFDAESVRQLFKTPFELQGRRVIDLDIGKVASVRIMSGDQVFLATKRPEGWFAGDSEKRLAGIDMSLWRFNELKFEALPLRSLPESAAWAMSCVFSDADGGKVASLTFFSDPELPEGQSWLKNGDELYYPVSNQLMKDLQGLFPATHSLRESRDLSAKELNNG